MKKMAFDPTKPVNSAPVIAAELRAQFNGLNDAIAQRATRSDIANAMAGTSANSNGVATLGFTVNEPPTAGDLQTVLNKLDDLTNALRR